MKPQRLVSYARVSTARQGASGLGLEAQRAAVAAYAAGGRHALVAEYVEVESGRRDDRPQLQAALAACRLHRATLVIAKLDRLARNVRFIAGIMDSGVDFVACDMPHANRLTLHLMAAMAEHEATAISERTKAALAATKARGVRLGNPRGAEHLRTGCREAAARSAAVRQQAKADLQSQLRPLVASFEERELTSSAAIARALNRRGVPSPTGSLWYRQQVLRCGLHLFDLRITEEDLTRTGPPRRP